MLLALLGLAIEKVYYPLSGRWWDGTDTSLGSITHGTQTCPAGGAFWIRVGNSDYIKLTRMSDAGHGGSTMCVLRPWQIRLR